MSGGAKTQTTSSSQTNEVPQWVKDAGQQIFQGGKATAERPYPIHSGERIADFTPEQNQAFDLTQQNVGSWNPAYLTSFVQGARGATPVGQQDIANYMNPFTSEVVARSIDDINRSYEREKIDRNASLSKRGSYLNEDRRMVIDNLAAEARDRNIGSVSSNAWAGAFNKALGQGNIDRDQAMRSSDAFSGLADQRSRLGYSDAQAVYGIGAEKEQKQQQKLTLAYEDFWRQFMYPQEQANWLSGLLRGVPYETTTSQTNEQLVAKSNPFSQALGLAATLGGAYLGAGKGAGKAPP